MTDKLLTGEDLDAAEQRANKANKSDAYTYPILIETVITDAQQAYATIRELQKIIESQNVVVACEAAAGTARAELQRDIPALIAERDALRRRWRALREWVSDSGGGFGDWQAANAYANVVRKMDRLEMKSQDSDRK